METRGGVGGTRLGYYPCVELFPLKRGNTKLEHNGESPANSVRKGGKKRKKGNGRKRRGKNKG